MNSPTVVAILVLTSVLCGLPMFLGVFRKQWGLGSGGFVVSVAFALTGYIAASREMRLADAGEWGHSIFSLLFGGPMAIAFCILILSRPTPPVRHTPADESLRQP